MVGEGFKAGSRRGIGDFCHFHVASGIVYFPDFIWKSTTNSYFWFVSCHMYRDWEKCLLGPCLYKTKIRIQTKENVTYYVRNIRYGKIN